MRQMRMSGWMPISRSFFTECWVGLVFSSPAGGDVRHQRQVHVEDVLARRRRTRIWRIASRNGSASMSPTVPPTSTIDAVVALGGVAGCALDLVGDVRDHLHRLAQVLAAALLAG